MDKSTWLERLAKRDSTIVDEIYGCLAISLTERLKRKWSHFDPHLADEFFGEALFRLYNNADDIHRVFQVSTPAGPAAYIYGYLWLKMDALAKDYYQKQNSIKSQRISATTWATPTTHFLAGKTMTLPQNPRMYASKTETSCSC